jgi:hypothetical protein
MKEGPFSRRDFIQLSALSLGALCANSVLALPLSGSSTVCLVAQPDDPIASTPAAVWAVKELGQAIIRGGVLFKTAASLEGAPSADVYIVAAGITSPLASGIVKKAGVTLSQSPESLALVPSIHQGKLVLLACGSDARGLMYVLLELAERLQHGENPLQELKAAHGITEEPFNEVRSIGRSFVSVVEDKPWYNDRSMWPEYFFMLAAQRINRFSLNFGIGFDTLEYVTDSYLLFAYPFLLGVPGYDVRAINLPDSERDHNLEMLQYISQQAVAHGIDFQLGIWTHGYQWAKTPHSNYTIEGITPENHAPYSRDALAAVLKACPDISGITIRTHGESGVKEGSYGFWKTVFDALPQSGRKVRLDLHSKGLDQKMIDSALATNMPLQLSPKYWAEHMGLPYQQTSIRELEMPKESTTEHAAQYYSLSTGSRIFTRYGYADFLREDRPYTIMYRIWPGTHRFLLWGDPVTNAAHSRAFRFCGCNGVELYEPLTFKGRRGSGNPGGRCSYADDSLKPRRDWEKYLYTYRTWGRLLYNPETERDVWRRQLRKQFPASSSAVESALSISTRIVPLITTTHLPSAANDTYGPEFYTNQSIVDASKYSPYGDTPAPKVFGNVSPLDPQMFSRINDFAAELLKGERSGKYSPIEVAQWLEDMADNATAQLAKAGKSSGPRTPEFRRMAADVKIEIGLGGFFAAKFRSGTLYGIHEQSGDRQALEESLKQYRRAREIWAQFAQAADAGRVYSSDISYGPNSYQRGNWLDRLPAMDDDIATMAKRLAALQSSPGQSESVRSAIQEALGRPHREAVICVHTPLDRFVPGKDLQITIAARQPEQPSAVRLYYRHVNQAEHYQNAEMQARDGKYWAVIPASYTDSKYPLQYYFEIRQTPEKAWLYPGFNAEQTNQPYYLVRQSARAKA